MSFGADASVWSTGADVDQPTTADAETSLSTTLEKEQTIKDIVQLRDGLRGLLVRIAEVEGDNEKLKKDNEMLAVYIDNL